MAALAAIPTGYADWLSNLKREIAQARQRAALGAKVIDRLAADLKDAFPDMRGWSASNLKYMRTFAQQCPKGLIGQQPADQLPWFHVVTLMTRLDAIKAELPGNADTDEEVNPCC